MSIENNEDIKQPLEFRRWQESDIKAIYDRLEVPNWAPWLVDGPDRLLERIRIFPQGQFLLKDEKGLPIACLSTNKLNWENAPDPSGLPPSWDYIAGVATGTTFESVHRPHGNALVILVTNIHQDFKAKGLSSKFLSLAIDLARKEGVDYVIGPFRPVGFGDYRAKGGEDNLSEYAALRRADGQRYDPWLRQVERNGGVFISECTEAMCVGVPISVFEGYQLNHRPDHWSEVVPKTWECGEVGKWTVDSQSGQAIYIEKNLWGVLSTEKEPPMFPEFRSLKITDKPWMEKAINDLGYVHCDMQFFGRWIWDGQKTQISQLNGNVVFKLTQGYSFLGNSEVVHTVDSIFEYQRSRGEECKLVCVPEEIIIDSLNDLKAKYKVVEQRDYFDYTYNLSDLASLEGSDFAKQRNKAQRFIRENSDVQIKTLDLHSNQVQEDILSVYDKWFKSKGVGFQDGEVEEEIMAIRNLLVFNLAHNIISLGIYKGNNMIGFSAAGVIGSEWIASYFKKADISYTGIYQYLEQKNAQILQDKGFKYLNREYDMGISSLRESKLLWRPVILLKKLAIVG